MDARLRRCRMAKRRRKHLAYNAARNILETDRHHYDLTKREFVTDRALPISVRKERSRGITVNSSRKLTEKWVLVTYNWRPPRGIPSRRKTTKDGKKNSKRKYRYGYPNKRRAPKTQRRKPEHD